MKRQIYHLVVALSSIYYCAISCYSQYSLDLSQGNWTGVLFLQNGKEQLPFKVNISDTKTSTQFEIINGDERILLDAPVLSNDSIFLRFPTFNSELVLHKKSAYQLEGYWINKNKNIRLVCKINAGYLQRFKQSAKLIQPQKDITGKWKTIFDQGSEDSYLGQAIFSQEDKSIKGTIRTETGDYKFLEGNIFGDSIYLSRFDGAHVLLFKGCLREEQIEGVLYSGALGKTKWNAEKNETFELTHPDSLTTIKTAIPIEFTLKNSLGELFSFPNNETTNKVVIIELMGTWCPNCLDEATYLKGLWEKYHNSGLSIIAIGYEVGETFEQHASRINRMKEKLALPYTLLVGGKASKQLAGEQFPMLNHVMSFPTTLFIDKKGNIRKIHTGFNGPATGEYYSQFKKETAEFIEQLLSE